MSVGMNPPLADRPKAAGGAPLPRDVGGSLADVVEGLGLDGVDGGGRFAPDVRGLVVPASHGEGGDLAAVRLEHGHLDVRLVEPVAGGIDAIGEAISVHLRARRARRRLVTLNSLAGALVGSSTCQSSWPLRSRRSRLSPTVT